MRDKKKIKSDNSLEKQMTVLQEQLSKAVADYQNLEKRVESEIHHFRQKSLFQLVDKLLSVLDDLERADCHIKEKGLTMAVGQFKEVLKSEGVEELLSDGEAFDPELMDCVEVVDGPKDIVVETILKGYRLNGNVVRPAKVKVGKGKQACD
jgi:molecular chaperone GrpE